MNITDDQEDLQKAVYKQNNDVRTFYTNITNIKKGYYKQGISKMSMKSIKEVLDNSQGYKESKDKLSYELDWRFIQSIAERMANNKGKYEPYNWKKPIDIESLKQSLFRHVVEVMEGKYEDDGRDLGHLEAIALNAMFIFYNLKNN